MATNLERFVDGMNRILGGLPGKAARGNQRVADDGDIAELPRNIFNYPLPWFGYDGKKQPEGGRNTTTLAAFVGWIDSGLGSLSRGLGEIKGSVDALTLAVLELTKKQSGIDQGQLDLMMKEAAQKALGKYELTKVESE